MQTKKYMLSLFYGTSLGIEELGHFAMHMI